MLREYNIHAKPCDDVADKVCINQLLMEIIWLAFLAET